MCGIIGEVRRAGRVDPERFDRLRDRLAHRGPDGAGTKLFEGGVARARPPAAVHPRPQ